MTAGNEIQVWLLIDPIQDLLRLATSVSLDLNTARVLRINDFEDVGNSGDLQSGRRGTQGQKYWGDADQKGNPKRKEVAWEGFQVEQERRKLRKLKRERK